MTEYRKLKVVVCGAHPDDPETGCGGTMALYSKLGHEVVALYLTRGERGISGKTESEAAEIRTKEAVEACKILNARPVFVGQIDGKCEINDDRYDEFLRVIEAETPDIVFTHWPIDSHPDHRICSNLAYDSWLKLGKKFALYYYEVMTGTQSQNYHPTDYVEITSTVDDKHSASFVHISQGIESLYAETHGRMEEFRGMEYGCKFAEAYVKHAQSSTIVLPSQGRGV
jgi:LmbE family N-acetylglucosaminyl deacetylase